MALSTAAWSSWTVGLVLGDQEALGIQRLLGDGILLHQLLKAGEVDAGIGQQGLIMGQGGLRRFQRDGEGPDIDHHEEVALLDDLALLEFDVGDMAADLALDGDGGQRRHRAQLVEGHRDIALGHGGDPHLDRRRGRLGAGRRRGRAGLAAGVPKPELDRRPPEE